MRKQTSHKLVEEASMLLGDPSYNWKDYVGVTFKMAPDAKAAMDVLLREWDATQSEYLTALVRKHVEEKTGIKKDITV